MTQRSDDQDHNPYELNSSAARRVAVARRWAIGWRQRYERTPKEFGPEHKETFITVLRALGRSGRAKAIEATGFCRMSVDKALRDDPAFREAAEEAVELHRAELTERLIREAIEGHEDAVFFKDKRIGTKKVLETQLRLQLLKSDTNYNDKNEMDVRHHGGVMVVPQPMSMEQWEQMFPAPAAEEVGEERSDDDEDL
jgi:hypothetical protein